jgi:hypothetical protein
MKCARSGLAVGLIVLCVLGISGVGRAGTLVLSPQRVPAEPGKWTLLQPESAMIDGDAVPLYQKAIQALPDKAGDEQIRKWLDMPIDQMPLDQVEQGLANYMDSLKSVAKATKCRQCNWPEWKPGMEIPNVNLEGYRRLAFVIRLWARLETASDGYEGAVLALQTGFGMGRHVGQGPTIVQGLVAAAIDEVMCKGVEELVQREGAPNLYPALVSLPKPLVDMATAIENERKAALSTPMAESLGSQADSQLKQAQDRAMSIQKRLESHLAALQCVEAIGAYMASHDGRLPAALADITEVSVPKDPMGDGPFRYTQTASGTVLESSSTADVTEKNRVRFEISARQ